MNVLTAADEGGALALVLRRGARRLGLLTLGGMLAVSLGACGDSSSTSASNSESGSDSGTESESETDGGESASASESNSGPSGSDSNSAGNASNNDPGGSASDSASGTSSGSGGETSATTGESTDGMISGGSSATESSTGETSTTSGGETTGPMPVVCSDLNNEQDCADEPECEPAKAERYNLLPNVVCKQDALIFMGCIKAEDCVEPSDDFYCFGDETKPWWNFLDTCVPDNYVSCNIPQQGNYPLCF